MIFYSLPICRSAVLRPLAPPAAAAWAPGGGGCSGCSSEPPSKGNAGGACGLLLTFPPCAQFQTATLAFDPTVKDSNFSGRGSQHFYPPTFQGSLSPWSTLAPGQEGASCSCAGRHHMTQVNAPKGPMIPVFFHILELLKRQRLGWDMHSPTRSPGHRITGYK